MVESVDHEVRRARALEVMHRFNGEQGDPVRGARAMERKYGALGSYAVDYIMGELWARPQLSRRDRSLLVVSVLMAQTRDEELELHTEIGLRHGLTRVEIEEALLHVAAYAGFPAAMASVRHLDNVWNRLDGTERVEGRAAAEHLDDDERDRRAIDVRRTLTEGRASADAAVDLGMLQDFLGDVGTVAFRWAFGEVWSRPGLSRRDRSLVVIAILGALGQEGELAFHVPGGLHHGLTRIEIEEVFVHLTGYAGFPRAVSGMRAARAAFAKLDATGA